MWLLSKEFTFEASHQLMHHDGKCARLHGHSWKGFVYVKGDTLQVNGCKQGMIMDYSEIKAVLSPIVNDFLDHWHLNDRLQMENPTSENVAKWIYEQMELAGLPVVAVRIDETCTSRCVYSKSEEIQNLLLMA